MGKNRSQCVFDGTVRIWLNKKGQKARRQPEITGKQKKTRQKHAVWMIRWSKINYTKIFFFFLIKHACCKITSSQESNSSKKSLKAITVTKHSCPAVHYVQSNFPTYLWYGFTCHLKDMGRCLRSECSGVHWNTEHSSVSMVRRWMTLLASRAFNSYYLNDMAIRVWSLTQLKIS